VEPKPTQNEEGLQENVRGSRASSSIRLVGGVNNAHEVLTAEEPDNIQGTVNRFETSAAITSLNDVVFAPGRELERGIETG
jgi:hypothetical protein